MSDEFHTDDEIRCTYEARRQLLKQLAAALQRETERVLSGIAHIDRIDFCVKPTESFVRKVLYRRSEHRYKNPFVEIDDQVRCRIVVFSLQDLRVVSERLTDAFSIKESSFRSPRKDEEFGYESHHLICAIPLSPRPESWNEYPDMPEAFEFQLRTLFMHAWAEQQHELVYKGNGGLPHEMRKVIAWAAASVWAVDREIARIWDWQRHREGSGNNGRDACASTGDAPDAWPDSRHVLEELSHN